MKHKAVQALKKKSQIQALIVGKMKRDVGDVCKFRDAFSNAKLLLSFSKL